jgi:ABC-type lipopolysaccharide export system ATPase subunit
LTKRFGHVLILFCSQLRTTYSVKKIIRHNYERKLPKIIALLGPTNTGKTHVAIEKMLEFEKGIFGLPLRLLAREVYDKCVD